MTKPDTVSSLRLHKIDTKPTLLLVIVAIDESGAIEALATWPIVYKSALSAADVPNDSYCPPSPSTALGRAFVALVRVTQHLQCLE